MSARTASCIRLPARTNERSVGLKMNLSKKHQNRCWNITKPRLLFTYSIEACAIVNVDKTKFSGVSSILRSLTTVTIIIIIRVVGTTVSVCMVSLLVHIQLYTGISHTRSSGGVQCMRGDCKGFDLCKTYYFLVFNHAILDCPRPSLHFRFQVVSAFTVGMEATTTASAISSTTTTADIL